MDVLTIIGIVVDVVAIVVTIISMCQNYKQQKSNRPTKD